LKKKFSSTAHSRMFFFSQHDFSLAY